MYHLRHVLVITLKDSDKLAFDYVDMEWGQRHSELRAQPLHVLAGSSPEWYIGQCHNETQTDDVSLWNKLLFDLPIWHCLFGLPLGNITTTHSLYLRHRLLCSWIPIRRLFYSPYGTMIYRGVEIFGGECKWEWSKPVKFRSNHLGFCTIPHSLSCSPKSRLTPKVSTSWQIAPNLMIQY